MLRELGIKNLAIIDDLRVRFESGFNVLTGETGAGKSIIVDSLGLALGSRAQSDLIRSGEKEAVVQAYFEIEGVNEFPDIGIDISNGLILRRTISATGKSRAYINDTMVSLQSLAEAGKSLVDIHGQYEHQRLMSVDRHRLLLDSYGKLEDDRKKMGFLYKEVQVVKKQETDLKQKTKERAHRLDLLRFQINEIDAAFLKPGEKNALNEERTILSNMSRLNELTETAYSMIYGSEGSCIERLSSVIAKVREMSSIDHSVSDILNMLESTLPPIEDAAISLRGYKNRYDLEPERLAEVEERLELIKKLEKKYGEGLETVISYKDEAEKELKGLELTDERLDSIEAELKEKEEMLLSTSLSLSEKRKKVANKMEALVKNELKELAFSNAEFLIDIRQEALSPHGIDKVEFLFSANPGEPPRPLAKIASGGELSRVMLALKTILADFDSIPVLIFDEVDAGIGGKTAENVGKKLKMISTKHQVLCTTHLPQIASKGDSHLKIEKRQKNERVYVEVRELKGREKLDEIARMLSGKITDVSLKHAKELIESAK
ncbi:MAG: DNA repair protein RecN [Nitrospirae bacterium RBG_13_41_22]|nr:MAG: DNA repair protein RecN [Nitrospirae bacterium RBG_13_41_22]OHE57570.1 MAG: DNA repair protein RecN [Thermodesulfovibrio sp. RBG_19FT_COMBO_42_12]